MVHNEGREAEQLNLEKIKRAEKGVLSFFVKKYRINLLLIIGIAIWGIIAGANLPREANPEVKVPFGVVTTIFPGASPADVEELVTDKIEEKIQNIDNVKLITSNSSLSVSSVAVEFEADADLEKSIQDLKDAVDGVTDLPSQAEDPIVSDVNINDQALVTFSFLGDLSSEEFKVLGERIQDELEKVPDVSRVLLVGVQDREIRVRLNEGEMSRLGVSVDQVLGTLRGSNISLPLGDLELSGKVYNIRATGKFETVSDIKNIVIRNDSRGQVLLGDIAVIEDILKERTSISRVSVKGETPKPAISVQIFKKTGGNIIEMVDLSKAKVEELQKTGVIPSSVQAEVTSDLSFFIRNDFNTLQNSGLQTVVMIFVLLTLALSFRKAIVATLTIPLVFFMSLGILSLTGSTLNSLVLFSLVLSMGLLVDTFIVLLEGIHDGIRKGYTPQQAAFYSLETYKWPIISGVLTTISAFVPMFLVSGILGEFLKTLPITISASLGSSLFIGLVILPGLSAWVLSHGKGIVDKETILEKYVTVKLEKLYAKVIREVLDSRKKKIRFVGGLIFGFVISLGLVVGGVIPVKLFPDVDTDLMFINIELPPGATLLETSKAVGEVEQLLIEIPEAKNFVSNVGVSMSAGDIFASSSSKSNTGQIILNLVDRSERDLSSFEIADRLRQKVKIISSADVTVEELSAGPPTGAPVEIRVLGDDLLEVEGIAQDSVGILETIPGVRDIETDVRTTPPDFNFNLKQRELGRYGLSAVSVTTAIRSALDGVLATSITLSGDDIDVVVFASAEKPASIEEVSNLNIITPAGQIVKLDQVADLDLAPAVEAIRHRDLKRIVNVRAELTGTTPAKIQQQFEAKVSEMNLSSDVEIIFGGEVEDIQQSFTELWYSMIVAVILIMFILVLQFDSFKQPFIILLTLPLATIGVVFGTLVTNQDFGFSTFLGVVALSGIVVNDAIILIDRINYNINIRKMAIKNALSEAGEARLEPIMMTTLTTIAGVTPLAFADEFWRGLSVAVAFGIAFATVLTLVMVPVLYLKFEGKAWMRSKTQ